MRTYSLAALAAAALLVPLPAAAADWWRVASGTSGGSYVDLQGIQPGGQWTRATQMLVYLNPSAETRVKTATAVAEYDCKRRVSRYRRFTTADSNGVQLQDMVDPDQLDEHAVDPGSVGATVMDFVCGIGRDRAVRVANPLTDSF